MSPRCMDGRTTRFVTKCTTNRVELALIRIPQHYKLKSHPPCCLCFINSLSLRTHLMEPFSNFKSSHVMCKPHTRDNIILIPSISAQNVELWDFAASAIHEHLQHLLLYTHAHLYLPKLATETMCDWPYVCTKTLFLETRLIEFPEAQKHIRYSFVSFRNT